jgi:hypothetical protein
MRLVSVHILNWELKALEVRISEKLLQEIPYDLEHKTNGETLSGKYRLLSATLYKKGAHSAISSQVASEVYLLLFDRSNGELTNIMIFENRTKYIMMVRVCPWFKGRTALWIQNEGQNQSCARSSLQ